MNELRRLLPWGAWLAFAIPGASAQDLPHQAGCLWFAQPAAKWTEALPIGNGRLGGMIFGGVPAERIQFNEDTLWLGHPRDYARPGAHDHLGEIRKLLFDGQADQAGKLARETFLGDPQRQMPYQPFGDLRFQFPGATNVTGYRRQLSLDDAVAEVAYQANGIGYRREAFASFPDQVIVLHFSADQPGQVSFVCTLDSPHTNAQTAVAGPAMLVLGGQLGDQGLRFESLARVINIGGRLSTHGNTLTVQNADAVTVLLCAATSFKNFQDITASPEQRCAEIMARAATRSYGALLAAHEADYRALFGRVQMDLGPSAGARLPTDERLQALRQGGLPSDPGFAALYFQFGRYLLIASSRPGGQPANLQGLWNQELDPPWESKWTLNINCEMNYWPAELGNLPECVEPLVAMIHDLAVSGARTAREQYGCRGWVVHHNTDLWRGTAPINNIDGIWPTGGAWLCHHLWEHYLFTGDTNFLARVYPDMKDAALFFVDDLVTDPRTGWLVTSPSYSPEQGTLCYGPTMDNQLVRALLTETIAAGGILKADADLGAHLAALCRRLPPNQVGKNGQLQEWLADIDKPNNNHRHMSPLWALYPGNEISPADPKIWDAARLLLKWRGSGSTGWSYAWRVPLWARAGDGDFAAQQLYGLFQRRTLPNLFDLCGPFQIDGNFGATAGIGELLLQSQWTADRDGQTARIVSLLPALPKVWPAGSVKGLCARDGFVVDLDWEEGKLSRAVLHARLDRRCRLRYGDKELTLSAQAGKDYAFDGALQPAAGN